MLAAQERFSPWTWNVQTRGGPGDERDGATSEPPQNTRESDLSADRLSNTADPRSLCDAGAVRVV